MKTEKNYHFGVMDLEKTKENHLAKLTRYRKVIKEGSAPAYNYRSDMNGFWDEELTPNEFAWNIYSNMNHWQLSYLNGYKSIRMSVNNYFRQNIRFYLERHNLPASWDTAVYLHTYKGFNTFMNKVANQFQKIIDNNK
jgi:hypothetical protein